MARARIFIPNFGIADELESDKEIAEKLRPLGERAAAIAQKLAPRLSGDYANSIHVVTGINEEGKAVARVVADDFKAGWIEKGTGPPGPTPASAPLRRGVESVVGNVK